MLNEEFSGAGLDPRLVWLNPPRRWQVLTEPGRLFVEPDASTDFWQQTLYGFRADNGHFLGVEQEGDAVISTRVRFHPMHQYDQAGLMLRHSADCWVKLSVEHELSGPPQLGAVVTSLGFSDWSLQDAPARRNEVELRLTRQSSTLTCEFRWPDEGEWRLMRVAHWHAPPGATARVGIYACSPKAAGFKAEFKFLRVAGAT